ncbi:hypothetical protein EM595_2125 [Duffyella gerundensis]|uniref:Uncharacterized protein n=1 Tax=Duffyella gerundensis TaxID=1619313 RepID=A0A0U5L799_9GAMM|nr:hypothetical protein EM595_2125 [Duffyella gerundensis]
MPDFVQHNRRTKTGWFGRFHLQVISMPLFCEDSPRSRYASADPFVTFFSS